MKEKKKQKKKERGHRSNSQMKVISRKLIFPFLFLSSSKLDKHPVCGTLEKEKEIKKKKNRYSKLKTPEHDI